MVQDPNQFAQSTEKGQPDLAHNNNIFPAIVADAQATPLVAGQAVLISNQGGKPFRVIGIPDDASGMFGVVLRMLKKSEHEAGEGVQIAAGNSIVYMEASEAITAGAPVMPVVAGSKVANAAAGGKTVMGTALDAAAADGDLVRVLLMDGTLGTATA